MNHEMHSRIEKEVKRLESSDRFFQWVSVFHKAYTEKYDLKETTTFGK
jgi:DNA-binding SARP family transcriptional activator